MACLERVDTIVVGGGQAGLAVGYHLTRRGLPFLIVDAGDRVGDAWRNRWDSLRLFSTRRYSRLDGMPLPGPPHGFPTKDEIADYLEAYARTFALPVRSGVRVDTLTGDGTHFLLRAGSDAFETRNVVVAMSTDQVPWTPPFASALDPAIVQMHSADFRSPSQLQDGAVLVVGVGNSGGEIAMELAAERSTLLAGDIKAHVPFRVERVVARYVALPLLFRLVAHHVLTVRTPMGRHRRHKLLAEGSPLVRVRPGDLVAAGVQRVARVTGIRDGRPLLADDTNADVSNVIWCTGYRPDYSWIDLPVFVDGHPEHHRGIVRGHSGLYFVGLPFLYAMSSGFLRGVSRDAAFVARHIARNKASHDTAHPDPACTGVP
jgi:putative flavoprotein involved in K+ transport